MAVLHPLVNPGLIEVRLEFNYNVGWKVFFGFWASFVVAGKRLLIFRRF